MPNARSSSLALCIALSLAALTSARASATPQTDEAVRIFQEARAICDRDGGRFWGRELCGPMLLVDPTNGAVVANEADPGGVLTATGAVWTGVLPSTVILSDTPVEWEGKRWTELLLPLRPKGQEGGPPGDSWRSVLLAHELFHRVQPELNLTRPEAGNQHLDTLQGRYLLQLEWRALAKALAALNPAARRAAVSDALLFRAQRYRLFPGAAAQENALEIDEGIPEYTGVRVGLATPRERTQYAIYDLSAFVDSPTFVRSFAYASGPAFGLLLDQADPAWRTKLNSGPTLNQLLSTAMRLPPPAFRTLKAREAAYDDGRLWTREVVRDHQRAAHLAALKARLVDGPVLVLPLHHANYQFNPQTLTPLGEFGTVYPTVRLVCDWGSLQVDSGGALFDKAMKTAAVSAAGADPSNLKGDGWRLTLNPGWTVQPGPRRGDWVVDPP